MANSYDLTYLNIIIIIIIKLKLFYSLLNERVQVMRIANIS